MSELQKFSEKRKLGAQSPSNNKITKQETMDIGMHILFTEHSGELLWQAIIIQDNFHVKNYYQISQCII